MQNSKGLENSKGQTNNYKWFVALQFAALHEQAGLSQAELARKLQKPFPMEEFTHKVREAMGTRPD